MDPLSIGLMTGGASLLGSIFSSQTSAQNVAQQIAGQQGMQKESEDFNAQQAQLNRDFQTQMSSTAYQRARTDMSKAGLNPMMMAGGGMSASSPSGSAASVGTPSFPQVNTRSPFANLGENVSEGIKSAVQAKTMDKMTDEMANLKADNARIAAATKLVRQSTETEVGRSEEAAAKGVIAQYGIPAARFGAKQAAGLDKIPQAVIDAAEQFGYGVDKAGKVTDLAGGLLSSALKHKALGPRRSTEERAVTGPSGDTSSFVERFHY